MFEKKNRTEDLRKDICRSSKNYVNMGLQATLLTSTALTAQVGALKQDPERSENKLGLAKKQLEDKEGE